MKPGYATIGAIVLALGAGPATDAARDAYMQFTSPNRPAMEQTVQNPSRLERILGTACAQGDAQATVPSKKYEFAPHEGVTIQEGYYPLPSTTGLKVIGRRPGSTIEGRPTVEVGYQKGALQLIVSYFNNKPFLFCYYDPQSKRIFESRGDYDGDGNFEQYRPEGPAKIKFDPKAYLLE